MLGIFWSELIRLYQFKSDQILKNYFVYNNKLRVRLVM